ncbi:MAG: hypothetical protein VX152_10000 [Pseudomonadota bacterium]|nr:hypothetical protein [Pseudomonadota bacterium]
MTDNDDILILIARRAGGERLNREEQTALDRAMLADPDLALLLLDAADVAAEATDAAAAAKQERRASGGRLRMAALVMGLAACFGLGATAGAQLASGLLSGGGMAIGSSQPTTQVEFRGVGDALNLKVRTGSREK